MGFDDDLGFVQHEFQIAKDGVEVFAFSAADEDGFFFDLLLVECGILLLHVGFELLKLRLGQLDRGVPAVDQGELAADCALDVLVVVLHVVHDHSPVRCGRVRVPIKAVLSPKDLVVVPEAKSDSGHCSPLLGVLKVETHFEFSDLSLVVQLLHIRFLVIRWRQTEYPVRLKIPNNRVHEKERHLPNTHPPSVMRPVFLHLVQTNVIFVLCPLKLCGSKI